MEVCFPLHYYCLVLLFPREGACRSKTLRALGAASSPDRVPACFSCGRGAGAHIAGQVMSQSPCSASVLCGFLKASIELQSPVLFFF